MRFRTIYHQDYTSRRAVHFSRVCQNLDNTEVEERGGSCSRIGGEGVQRREELRRAAARVGSRDHEVRVGDRLRRYMHNNRGMESCIRAKQPICPAQWKRRRCGPDLITRGCLWQAKRQAKERERERERVKERAKAGSEALSEAPYTAELRLMAAQECEFGDMPGKSNLRSYPGRVLTLALGILERL